MVTSTQDKQPSVPETPAGSPRAPSAGAPDAASPTFHATVSSVEPDDIYAEISITCQFRDVADLRDWIFAGTFRLIEDINAKTEPTAE